MVLFSFPTVLPPDLVSFTKLFFKFGKLVQYPGKMFDYGYGNTFVGRMCEAAKDMENEIVTSQTRFEDVLAEKIIDRCGVEKFIFYVTPDDPQYEFFTKEYHKLHYLLFDGRSKEGTRVLRASTVRMLTDSVNG